MSMQVPIMWRIYAFLLIDLPETYSATATTETILIYKAYPALPGAYSYWKDLG